MSAAASALSTDLPVVTEGIDDTADPPAMAFGNRVDHLSAGSASPRKQRIWIGIGDKNADAGSLESLWTEVSMLGRFVADPELRTADGEPRHDAFFTFMPICLDRTKCVFVELDGFAAVSNKQPWSDGPQDL